MPLSSDGRVVVLLSALLLLSSCGRPPEAAPAAVTQGALIRGADDRTDAYAHPDAAMRTRVIESVAAVVLAPDLDLSNPNDIVFPVSRLHEQEGLCLTERFVWDRVPSRCAATLIDDDLVLLAASCLDGAAPLVDVRFLFRFFKTSESGEHYSALETLTTADLFSVDEVLFHQLDGDADLAVVRLDRAATPRFTPAPVELSGAPAVGDSVGVISTPSGLQLMIDTGGVVTEIDAVNRTRFQTTSDSFRSGSGGVFGRPATGPYPLLGVQHAGTAPDYVWNDTNSCNVLASCSECEPTTVSYADRAVRTLCATATYPHLCPVAEPPETTLTAAPAPLTADTSASFAFQASKQYAPLECALDGVAFEACSSPLTFDDLADGEHVFLVRGSYGGAPDETPAEHRWTIDTIAPETALDSRPESQTTATDAHFTFSSNEQNVTFECSVDEAPFQSCTSPHEVTDLPLGDHAFAVRATDAVGHLDPSPAQASWRVEAPPEVPDAGAHAEDGGVSDAGVEPTDAGPGDEGGSDAGVSSPSDGGVDGGTDGREEPEGCGSCSSGPAGALPFAAVLLLRRRRRR